MKILVVDDHPLTGRGLVALLQGVVDGPGTVTAVRCVHSVAQARSALADAPPDWLFLDVNLPDDPARTLFEQLCAGPLAGRTVLLSADAPPELVHQGLASGMRGFVPKSAEPDQVLAAFAAIRAGSVWLPPEMAAAVARLPAARPGARGLSPRLLEVQALVLRGASNKAIARQMGLSEHTVKEYMSSILAFHGVTNRLELVLQFQRPDGG